MHIHWYRMTDGRACSTPRRSTGWRSTAIGRCGARRGRRVSSPGCGARSAGHQTLDDWWEPLRYQHRIAEIDLPVLHISGWYDDEEIGTPANFAAMAAAGRSGQRLLMGPWGHRVNAGATLGELDFGHHSRDRSRRGDGRSSTRRCEADRPPVAIAPVRIFLMGANEWLDLASWPPPGGDGAQLLPRQRRPRQLPLRRWAAGSRRRRRASRAGDEWSP